MRTRFKKPRFIDTGDYDTEGYYTEIELEYRDITLFNKYCGETLNFATPEEAFDTYIKYIKDSHKALIEDVMEWRKKHYPTYYKFNY